MPGCTATIPERSSTFVLHRALTFLFVGRVRCSGWYHGCDDNRAEAATDAEDAAADDVVEGHRADTLFWFDEAVFEDTALLLGDEGKDHLYATAAARCLQEVESTFPVEESAPRISPGNQDHLVDAEAAEPKQQVEEEAKGVGVDVPTPPTVVTEHRNNVPSVTSPAKSVSIEGKNRIS